LVLAFGDSPERWSLLGTRKVVSLHDGETHEFRLEHLCTVEPWDRWDSTALGATMDGAKEWKRTWEFLRVRDNSGRITKIWVPCGAEAYALWNILLMFPPLSHCRPVLAST
jgi:hypothetical protein